MPGGLERDASRRALLETIRERRNDGPENIRRAITQTKLQTQKSPIAVGKKDASGSDRPLSKRRSTNLLEKIAERRSLIATQKALGINPTEGAPAKVETAIRKLSSDGLGRERKESDAFSLNKVHKALTVTENKALGSGSDMEAKEELKRVNSKYTILEKRCAVMDKNHEARKMELERKERELREAKQEIGQLKKDLAKAQKAEMDAKMKARRVSRASMQAAAPALQTPEAPKPQTELAPTVGCWREEAARRRRHVRSLEASGA